MTPRHPSHPDSKPPDAGTPARNTLSGNVPDANTTHGHTASGRPLDGKTFALGVLSVTACILFVGYVLISQRPAYAIGESDRAGDYKMLTQQLSNSAEGLVVVDAAAKQLIIYGFDYDKKVLEIVYQFDLTELPKPREADGVVPPRPPGRR